MRTLSVFSRHFFLLLLLLIVDSNTLNAQDISYSFSRSEPKRLKFVGQVKLFDLDCGMSDPFRIGVGLQADYYSPKLFSLHAAYYKTLFGIANMNAKILNSDDNALSKYWNVEVGGRIYLSDKISTKKMRIVLSSEYVGYNTVMERSARFVFPCRKIVGLRGGIYKSVTPVTSNWNTSNSPYTDNTPGLQTTDGQVYGKYNEMYTNMNSFGFYGGLSFVLVINADYSLAGAESGRYSKRFFRETYIDMLYEPSTSFDAIIVKGVSHSIDANAAGSFRTSQLGFRIGENVLKAKGGALTLGLEAGDRPGISGRGLYFASRVGISIANRTKDKRKRS